MIQLLTEADYLAYRNGCSYHAVDAVNGVLDVGGIAVSGKDWAKTHNVFEINLTAPGVNVANIHDIVMSDMRLIAKDDHGDGIRIKGSATPPGPIVNVWNIKYDRFGNGFLPLFCGEGYVKELNIWGASQSAGADGGWPQQWIGSVKCPLLRVYSCGARTCVQCDSGTLGAINVDETAVAGRFAVNAGPAAQRVPWTPPNYVAPVPVIAPAPVPVIAPAQMGDLDAMILIRHGSPARVFISDAKGDATLTITDELFYHLREVTPTKLLNL